MEFMAGGSLQKLMMKKSDNKKFVVPTIPYALRLQFCADICSGVTFLHHNFGDERIVHGDIKPANILLNKNLDCKIADFGGAQIATISDNISKPQPQEKGVQWTLGYIAPERQCCDVRLSKAMDVYSVGATFYLILQREHPSQYQDDFVKQMKACSSCTVYCAEDHHFNFLKKLVADCCNPDPKSRS